MANGDGVPTTNKELWVFLKALPWHLQTMIVFIVLASSINIPDGVFSLLRYNYALASIDTLTTRVDSIEEELASHTKQNEALVIRVDSIADVILQNRESLDYLWCLNEKSDLPEVRKYCGDLREAVRAALRVRAGVVKK